MDFAKLLLVEVALLINCVVSVVLILLLLGLFVALIVWVVLFPPAPS